MDWHEASAPGALNCGTTSIPTIGSRRDRCRHHGHNNLTPLTSGAAGAEVFSHRRRTRAPARGALGLDMLRASCVWVVVLGLLVAPGAEAFNVDLETAVVHQGTSGSMFGYAVAQHVDQSTNWLLIGAPKFNTTQNDVVQGGAVFRCKTDVPSSCQAIPFDNEGNNIKYDQRTGRYLQLEEKSDQWFGSTVKSSGENGYIVACAPRYVYFTNDLDKREPIGVCYLAKASTTKFEKYSPCSEAVDRSDITDQYHRQGYCQAGFSAVFSSDGRRLLIGAPGSWYWQGQLFQFDAVTSKKLTETQEQSTDRDYGYMGYASAIGEFDGDNFEDYIVGIPKGEDHHGKVEFFDQNMTSFGSLLGEQIGSYFGSSLAVADLNGDRLDDVIVGAPHYAEFGSSDAFDTGRVYIYYQSADVSSFLQKKFRSQRRDILDGYSSQSRFGMAISGVGDINYDGYDDLCVGAPYAGDDKAGAIYIYHGSKKGIITDASQIIYAKDISPALKTFGVSISGGIDQDLNQYPDMLVGSYASDRAVFLRTRPVVRVFASLKLDPLIIDLDTQSCGLADGTRVACLNMFTCVEYSGVGVPADLFFNFSWVLDAKGNTTGSQEQRVFLINMPNRYTDTIHKKLYFKKIDCITTYAYVKNDPDDKLSPIKATLEFTLSENPQTPRRKRELDPILDAYIPTTASFTAQIKKDCGIDNVCIPDLAVSALRVSAAHVIGSTATVEILVIVTNLGEDSFNTKLWITLPPGVAYDTITSQRSSVPISCGTFNQTLVVCDLGNPLKQKAVPSEFTLNLTPTNTNETKDQLLFTFYGNSSNEEQQDGYSNNYHSVQIPVIAVAEIALFGKASPELIVLNTTEQQGEEIGRTVKHVFQLLNQGQSATNETQLQIRWPSYDKQGNPVLAMKGGLSIEGNGKCNIIIITPNNASDFSGWDSSNTQVAYREEGDREKRNTDSQNIMCTEKYCTIIQCLIGYMAPYHSFVITIESELKARSFIQRREETQMYHITSIAHAKVLSVPYDFKSVDITKFETKRLSLVTKVNTDRLKPTSKGVEIWIIALAVTGGLLMLLLLILLLWWCGFFKRKKPEEEGYFVVNGKSDIDNKIVD
ncbi:unnamed protein product [Lymnaea stagnalis]|uniref:Integrin alpha-2 domain-containing protein n=1 Tax=Lymnaea stagnalis TaxID=6523 RepID=A0AAV2HID8_LYMST